MPASRPEEQPAKSPLRVGVLVTEDPSDVYFANQLLKQTNVVGIIVERQKALSPQRAFRKLNGNPWRVIEKIGDVASQRYYARQARRIARMGFGAAGFSLSAPLPVVYTEPGVSLNDPRYQEVIAAWKADLLAVCGTSILKPALLEIPPLGVLNLHGGLAQHYRGVWTTLWAIYNKQPQYVGYTVHFVAPGIDDGDIIFQGRPQIEAADNQETLYVKVVKQGTAALVKAIQGVQGGIPRHPLPQKGKLYLSSQVTPAVVRQTWRNVRAGLIREYVKNPQAVDLLGAN